MADEYYPPYKCPYDHEFHSADDLVFYYPATGFIETIEEAQLTAHAFRDANGEAWGIWQSVLVPRRFVAVQGHAGFCLEHYDYCWLRHVVLPTEVDFLEERDNYDDDDDEMFTQEIIRNFDDPTFPAGFEADWMEEVESVFEDEEEDSDEEGLYRPPTPPRPNTTRIRVEKEEEQEQEEEEAAEAAAAEERYGWTAGRIHFPFELRQPEVRQPEVKQPDPDYSVWPRVRYYRY